MPLLIPTQALPSQIINTSLNGQAVQLNIRQQARAMFMDVLVNNALVIGGVICQNLNLIVRDAYLGFSGDLAWFDTQGSGGSQSANPPLDPYYTGVGTRFQLWYWYPYELAAAGLS